MTTDTDVDQPMEALVFHLLDWLEARDRTYDEVIEVWQRSCPGFPVWNEVRNRGFVTQPPSSGKAAVRLTSSGAAVLRNHRFLEIMRNYLKIMP